MNSWKNNLNSKNSFSVLGEGLNDGISDSTGAAEKDINFRKAKTKFCLKLHCNADENYLYVNKTDIKKIKANDNTSYYNFCLGSVLKHFTRDEMSKNFVKDTLFDFWVDHRWIKIRRHS